jgi:hypothetical protein
MQNNHTDHRPFAGNSIRFFHVHEGVDDGPNHQDYCGIAQEGM